MLEDAQVLARDGNLDIVTPNSDGSTVVVLLGKGDGTFAAKADHAAGDIPLRIAIGDLDGDGKPDILVSGLRDAVSVLLGKGDGSFATPQKVLAEGGPGIGPLALGDVNGDGKLDLAFAPDGVGSVSVLLGKGDGSFGSRADYPGQRYSHWLGQGAGTSLKDLEVGIVGLEGRAGVLGDLNGDGRLDLVTADGSPGALSVLVGQGDGTFPSEVNYSVDANALALGDVNRDGRLDVVAASGDSTVSVMLTACRQAPGDSRRRNRGPRVGAAVMPSR